MMKVMRPYASSFITRQMDRVHLGVRRPIIGVFYYSRDYEQAVQENALSE